jgi:integrase
MAMASAGWIEDRWLKKRPDPVTGKRERTALWGTNTKRYRVCGIPGVRRRSFDSAGDAKAWLKKAATDTARGDFYDPRAGTITLDEYVRTHYWPTLRQTPTTKQSMRSRVFGHILPHAGHNPLSAIGYEEIKGWVAKAERNIDVNTLITTWRHFSSIMQAAHAAKRIPANPFRDPEVRKLKPAAPKSKAKAWPQERVAAVWAAMTPRYRLLIDEGIGAGLRQGEAFALSPDDLDGEDIHVTRQVIVLGGRLAFAPPKGNKERDAPCPPELAEAIKLHMEEYPPVEVTLPWVDPTRPSVAWEDRPRVTVRLLVTTPLGNAVNRTKFDDKQWKAALARVGVIPAPRVERVKGEKSDWRRVVWEKSPGDGFHALRHTFASVTLQAGETIQKLAQWLGHSDPAFTYRTYAHFLPEAGSRGLAVLGQWLAAARSPTARADGETPSAPPEQK